ncbi:hypothetical protein Rhe02_15610 [Rhizocola hellebori]|uniref:Major facilitator superfamily (MFS) profile domain-containing protein n=1 Tax=Rhizocola hellebori TaxID=1392758 RepID=A0A8J3Q491_9ACTN|nr:MFS transporter [Rhizocola hellebori]GIH03494.1 hypothetical protein Rhe02_15610 [Rhizocola hellebori]
MRQSRTTIVTVATGGMAASMLPLYTISALGPYLVADLGLSRAALGAMVTAAFAVAAIASVIVGRAVDALGARTGLALLFAVVSAALLTASFAPKYVWLLSAIAVAGIAQALANPATNVLIAKQVDQSQRASAIGIKQSGVQLAAFACGVAMPALATAWGWRAGLRFAVLLPVVMLIVLVLWVPPTTASDPSGAWRRWSAPSHWLRWLMGYSLLLGTALAAVNTYLPLYATQRLAMATTAAGAVLAAFGVSGLVARLWWTRIADHQAKVTAVLSYLSAGAAGCTLLVWIAAWTWPAVIWLGAVGIGATATAGNAVSMLAVVRRGEAAGHASAMVSLGFFTGFVLGPASFGALADALDYGPAWIAVAVLFGLSALVSIGIPEGRRLPPRTS